MIETTNLLQAQPQAAPEQRAGKVLKMVRNERMGGYVPAWETIKTSQDSIEANLAQAQYKTTKQDPNAYSYGANQAASNAPQNSEFGFRDLVDIVNPLHHVPVVGFAYRELTGDTIKPISQIVGGTVFGGPIGAASGVINAIVESETGSSIESNAMALAFGKAAPNESNTLKEQTPQRATLNKDHALTNSLLAFSNLGYQETITIAEAPARKRSVYSHQSSARYNG